MKKIICILNFLSGTFASDSNLIITFLKSQDRPSTVIDYCFSTNNDERVVLSNIILKAGYQFSTLINLNNAAKYQKQYFLILMHIECPFATEKICEASSKGLFRSPYRWFVIYDSNITRTEHPVYQVLLNSPLLADSDVVLAHHLENDTFELTELHKPGTNSSVIETAKGIFKDHNILETRTNLQLFRRRKNLMMHPLTMINVIVDSNSSVDHIPKEDRLEPQYDSLSKICWIIVRMGFQMLNATPLFTFASSFGYRNENNSWNGAINMIITHQADLGTSCLPTHDRFEVVNFIEMVAPTKVAFIFRQPPLSYVANIYSLPFSTNVWLATIVCVIVAIVTLYFASKFESKIDQNSSQPDGSLGDVFLLALSAVCQQGCVLEPKKASGRMMVLFIFTALMALYAAYSANIVVLLRAPSSAIVSLQQLYNSKLTLAASDANYNHFLLKQQVDPLRRGIYTKISGKSGKSHFYNLDEGVQKIRKGLFAFHSMKDPIYRRIENTFQEIEKCDLVEIDLLNQFEPFLPAPKDSPYTELFKVVFKQIRESGLQAAVVNRLQVPKPKCSGSGQAFSSVGFVDFYPAIVFMLYGFCIALFILLIEIIIHRARK